VDETERHLIRDYQKRLDISELEHLTCLQEHGWTLLGWERGSMDSCQASAQQKAPRGCRPLLQTPQGVVESAQELQRASEIIDGVLEGLRRAAQADGSASSCAAVASTSTPPSGSTSASFGGPPKWGAASLTSMLHRAGRGTAAPAFTTTPPARRR